MSAASAATASDQLHDYNIRLHYKRVAAGCNFVNWCGGKGLLRRLCGAGSGGDAVLTVFGFAPCPLRSSMM
jgi:hypothetical protein